MPEFWTVYPPPNVPATWYTHGSLANAADDPPSWGTDYSYRDPSIPAFSDWIPGTWAVWWGNGPAVPTELVAEYLLVMGASADDAITAIAVAIATTALITSGYAKDESGHEYWGPMAGDTSFKSSSQDDTLVESANNFASRYAIDGFGWFRQYSNGAYQQYLQYVSGIVNNVASQLGITVAPPQPQTSTNPDAPIAAEGWRRMTYSMGTTAPSTAYGIQILGDSLWSAIN